ncbi:phosphate-starvation-inducible protein PsiE [Loktanella sp. DSM 29012]|uniref:phosphate-starvation-inducible protein PsiE n=1 Tax=Loktanella sp. DSM 29012 TaxID=1881056 RepID=UPI00210AC4BD|nr:phosphate-starvation-inducible PsiE family protein [Loktanella sp. DSM 29012]
MTQNKDTADDIDIAHTGAGPSQPGLSLKVLHLIERFLLSVVVLLTVGGAVSEIFTVVQAMSITLADILLMFLYAEVIGMVIVFFADRNAVFVYPIFIAITALARLIILQGKDMAPENILYEAVSILFLTIAALIIIRVRKR